MDGCENTQCSFNDYDKCLDNFSASEDLVATARVNGYFFSKCHVFYCGDIEELENGTILWQQFSDQMCLQSLDFIWGLVGTAPKQCRYSAMMVK